MNPVKKRGQRLALGAAFGLALLGMGCSVERTQSAKAPDIDVDVDPGRWPKYDVKWADVDVGSRTKTVTVPKLEWRREQVQVEVPYIDINPPGATNREERNLNVELEVPDSGYDLRIREVRAAGDTLWVISELTATGQKQKGPARVSDQVVVNAPEDLNVRYVIIGDRPTGVYNQQYTFVPSRAVLDQRLPEGGGRVIYQQG
jgi:hypothetical protein